MIRLLFFLLPLSMFSSEVYVEPWGEDAELSSGIPTHRSAPPSFGVYLSHFLISFHQNVLSPIDGPRSQFRPSSSNYMRLAMKHHGFLQGFLMGCDRLLREDEEEWIYRKIEENGKVYKYDPPWQDKFSLKALD